MKLADVNAWITLIANVGIVAGLIFLGLEFHQNTTQLRTESSYSVNEALSMLNAGIYNNSVLADILERGEEDLSSLDPSELRQFVAYQFDRINLAIHIQSLETDGISKIHFPYVDFLIGQFQAKQGLQDFLVLIEDEWAGSRVLYESLRKRDE